MKIISRWKRSIEQIETVYSWRIVSRCICERNFPFPLTSSGRFEGREIWNEKNVRQRGGEGTNVVIMKFYREIYECFADFLLLLWFVSRGFEELRNATRYVIWLKAWEALRAEPSALITIIDVPRWRNIVHEWWNKLFKIRHFRFLFLYTRWERNIRRLILNFVKSKCAHFDQRFIISISSDTLWKIITNY